MLIHKLCLQYMNAPALAVKSSCLNWNAQYGNLANRWLSDNRAVLLIAIRWRDRGMKVDTDDSWHYSSIKTAYIEDTQHKNRENIDKVLEINELIRGGSCGQTGGEYCG